MVTYNDAQRRAELIVAVRGQVAALTSELEEKVWLAIRAQVETETAALSAARLNGLAQSLAWHERRQSEALRLDAFGRELARLLKPVLAGTSRADLPLYEYLLLRVWHPWSAASRDSQIEQTLKDLAIDRADRSGWHTFLNERWDRFPLGAYERRILGNLPIPADEESHWTMITRLALARTAMQIALTLANADSLRQAIETEGGALLWQ